MAELIKKAKELGKKEQQLVEREKQLNERERQLNERATELSFKEQDLIEDEYNFHLDVIGSAHCKDKYIKNMGVDFWEEHLASAVEAGKLLGKDEDVIKQGISYAMVYIYKTLELWGKAYDYLVEQAKGYAWLSETSVQRIVKEVGYCEQL